MEANKTSQFYTFVAVFHWKVWLSPRCAQMLALVKFSRLIVYWKFQMYTFLQTFLKIPKKYKKIESNSYINFGGEEVFKADCLLETNHTFLGQDLSHVSHMILIWNRYHFKSIIFFKHLSIDVFLACPEYQKSESNSYINNDKTKVESIAIENHLTGDLIDDHTFSSKFTLQLVWPDPHWHVSSYNNAWNQAKNWGARRVSQFLIWPFRFIFHFQWGVFRRSKTTIGGAFEKWSLLNFEQRLPFY